MCEDTSKGKPTLEELRKKAGKSRAQLAQEAGMSEGTSVYDIERKGAIPRADRLVGMARSLGVSVRVVCESIGLDLTGVPYDTPQKETIEP